LTLILYRIIYRQMKGNRGGKRKGAGRPTGSTGKELKKRFSVRAYPSDINILRKKGVTLQKAVDFGIEWLKKRGSNE